MNYRQSPFGPVAIIPATALRNNRTLLRQLDRSQTGDTSRRTTHRTNTAATGGASIDDRVPINLAYYLSPRRATSTPIPAATQPPPFSASASTTLKRRDTSGGGTMYPSYPPSSYVASLPRVYRTRSYTTTSIFNEPVANGRSTPTHLKAVSGPVKYPEPLYRKRAYSRSRSADWMGSAAGGGGPMGWTTAPSIIHPAPPPPPILMDSPVRTLGRRTYHYPASYATYPPSTFYGAPEKEDSLVDNVLLRVVLKIAQLVVGAVVIGTVAGPAQGEPFSTFAARTQSAGQVYVLVIACLALIMTTALLTTIYFAKRSRIWRNVDGIFNAIAAFLYLVAGCVEAWYANCYPPFGNSHPETCRLVAWAIASIFAFVNLVLYAIDFVFAALAGIDF